MLFAVIPAEAGIQETYDIRFYVSNIARHLGFIDLGQRMENVFLSSVLVIKHGVPRFTIYTDVKEKAKNIDRRS